MRKYLEQQTLFRWYSIGTTFNGNTEIRVFKELYLFTQVTSIPSTAFSNSGIAGIDIPNTITTIGYRSFINAKNLTDVVLPASVTSIQGDAFYNSGSAPGWLETFTMHSTTPPTLAAANVFRNQTKCVFYVPASAVDTYKSASVWSVFASRIEAIP